MSDKKDSPDSAPLKPAYESPPAYAEPPAPRHHGLLLLPYVGLNRIVGSGSDGFDAGFRMGGLIGAYVGPFLSLNAELSINFLKAARGDATAALVGFTFSPLFHFGPPNVDFVLGPRLGFYGEPYRSHAFIHVRIRLLDELQRGSPRRA